MRRYAIDDLSYTYDAFTDVLYVTFRHAASVTCTETPRGFLLRHADRTGELVGVTILDFVDQFGSDGATVEIDAPERFSVEIGPVDVLGAAHYG